MNASKKTLVYLFMGLAALASVVPFIWMLVTSLKTQAESIQIPLTLLPAHPSLQAYGRVMHEIPFVGFYLNSLLATFFTVTLQMAIATLAAYGFSRLHFRGRDAVFLVCVSILMVPGQAFLIPQFLVVQKLGLVNSITGLVLPGIFSVYATFLLRQFFMTLPDELLEAARIDGAGPMRFFWDIVLPLSKTNLAALFVITFIYGWNQYLWPILITSDASMGTAVAGIKSMISTSGAPTQWNQVMAAMILTLLPPLAVVLLMQRWFVRGLVDSEK